MSIGTFLFWQAQHRARFPEFREELLVECEPQVGRASAATRACSEAYRTFDHLHMPQPPADHQFVEFGEPLADVNPVAKIALVLIDVAYGVGASFEKLCI